MATTSDSTPRAVKFSAMKSATPTFTTVVVAGPLGALVALSPVRADLGVRIAARATDRCVRHMGSQRWHMTAAALTHEHVCAEAKQQPRHHTDVECHAQESCPGAEKQAGGT